MLEIDEPPIGADVDVSRLSGFMLDTERLLASELWALTTGEEFKAAMGLWCRAWKQTPPASLPDNDRVLASFAGVPLARWPRVKAMALHGFMRCRKDGRLYHPVLAADAQRASNARRLQREKGLAGARAKHGRPPSDAAAPAVPVPPPNPGTGMAQARPEDGTGMAQAPPDPGTGSACATPSATAQAVPGHQPNGSPRKERKGEESPSPDGEGGVQGGDFPARRRAAASPADLAEAVEDWNALAHDLGLPTLAVMTGPRREKLGRRLVEAGGLDGWRAALTKIRESPFLRGDPVQRSNGHANWRCTFDFVVNAGNFAKIMEGNYDDKRGRDAGALAAAIDEGVGAGLAAARAGSRGGGADAGPVPGGGPDGADAGG